MTKTQKLVYELRMLATIFLASLLTALSLELFLIPNDIVLGGAAGIAVLLDMITSDALYFSAGVWVAFLNIPIMIYFFVTLTRRYATKALIYVVLVSAFMLLLRAFDVVSVLGLNVADDGNSVTYILLGGALSGLPAPLMLSINSSTGGSDIVGLILQQKRKKSSADGMRFVLLTNVIIVFLSAVIVYFLKGKDATLAIKIVVYSIAAIFVREIVQETVFKGFSSAIELVVTTTKPLEVSEALKTELKHGVSILKVVGSYSQQERAMVICVIEKRQLTAARRVVRKADQQAFAFVENVREVLGLGFHNKEVELENENEEAETKVKKKK